MLDFACPENKAFFVVYFDILVVLLILWLFIKNINTLDYRKDTEKKNEHEGSSRAYSDFPCDTIIEVDYALF